MATVIDHQIDELARRQRGVVTREQLMGLGLRPGALRRRLDSGRMSRLHRGVYRLGPLTPPLARETAAVLACGPTALLSQRSAASLWGLVTPPAHGGAGGVGGGVGGAGGAGGVGGTGGGATAPGRTTGAAPVQVTVVGSHGYHRPGIRVRRLRTLASAERTCHRGIPVTSPARTLLDLAAEASAGELERAVARADRERLVAPGELEVLIRRHRGRPGAPALRALIERTDGPSLTRSEAERRFLALIREARLPAPEANARVGRYEVDFLWRTHGLAVEVDGYRFHASRSRFEYDRRRATWLAARGIQVIPITWRQITEDGLATAVRLGEALVHARARRRDV